MTGTQQAVSVATIGALVVAVVAFGVIVAALWVGLSRARSRAFRTLLMGTAVLALIPVAWLLVEALALVAEAFGA